MKYLMKAQKNSPQKISISILNSMIAVLILGLFFITPILSVQAAPTNEPAPTSAEVVVLYNTNYIIDSDADTVQDSLELANYYKAKRGIPAVNVIGLPMPVTEAITRSDYATYVSGPMETALTAAGIKDSVKFIVLIKGVPLKIKDTVHPTVNQDAWGDYASVDSELCMLFQNYQATAKGNNPYLNIDPTFSKQYHFKSDTFTDGYGHYVKYLVTRLDAFNAVDVKAMIDRAYDADTTGNGYYITDSFIASGPNTVTYMAAVNSKLKSMGMNVIPDPYVTGSSAITYAAQAIMGYVSRGTYAGLYGDYYEKSFDFNYLNGAVTSTYESFTASSFTRASQGGMGNIAQFIAAGGSGGIGNVYEPFSDAIARESIWMPAYAAGYTWAEAAYMSLPYMSWVSVVLGDPLMTIAPNNAAPATPSNAQASNIASDTLNLSWTNPSSFYKVDVVRGVGSYPESVVDGTSVYEGTNNHFSDSKLDASTDYYYSIFARDKFFNYSNAANVAVTTITDLAAPSVPGTPRSVSSPVSNSPRIMWSVSLDSGTSGLAATPYTLDYSTEEDFSSSVTTVTTAENYFDTSDLNDGTWYARVKAIDNNENISAYSPVGSFVVNSNYSEPTPSPIDTSVYAGFKASDALGAKTHSGTNPIFSATDAYYYQAAGMNVPRYTSIDSVNHRMFIADTGNNRVLVFNLNSNNSFDDYSPDYILGQTSYDGVSANKGMAVSASSFSKPQQLAYDSTRSYLYVVDSNNNRVVVYDLSAGINNGMSASYVLGQANFTTSAINAGAATSALGMNAPGGVVIDSTGDRIFVSEFNNPRVLVFNISQGISNGMAASYVLGQTNFTNKNIKVTQSGFNKLESLGYDKDNEILFVPDPLNARVLIFDARLNGSAARTICGTTTTGIANSMNASCVLGQSSWTTSSTNLTQNGFDHPFTAGYDSTDELLFIGDYLNQRVVVYDVNLTGATRTFCGVTTTGIANNMNASCVLGESDFITSIQQASQNHFAGPYSVTYDPTTSNLYVADLVNNRIMIFDISNGISNGMLASDVLNQRRFSDEINFNTSFSYNASSLGPSSIDEPAGLIVDEIYHRLFVSDKVLNRILIYDLDNENKLGDYNPDGVIGQSSLFTSVSNSGGYIGSGGLENPSGMAWDADNKILYVADSDNNRILGYDLSIGSEHFGIQANFVLGQSNFGSHAPGVSASSLNEPGYLSWDKNNKYLFVSDNNNNRVIGYDLSSGIENGMDASFVFGQSDFNSNSANGGSGTAADKLSGPQGIAVDVENKNLFVADYNNNRILVFNYSEDIINGVPASYVIGQDSFSANNANKGTSTNRSGFGNLQGLAFDQSSKTLFVADQYNNRVLSFDVSKGISNGMPASLVLGQVSETTSYGGATQVNLYQPLALNYIPSSGQLFVGDSQNNRVLVFSSVNLGAQSTISTMVNESYSGNINIGSHPEVSSYGYATGAVPPGMSINGTSVNGTPTTPGTYGIKLVGTKSTNWGSYDLFFLPAAAPLSIKVLASVNPSAPGTPSVSGNLAGGLPTISWNVSVAGQNDLAANPYVLEYSAQSDFATGVVSKTNATNEYIFDTALEVGTWFVRIKAIDQIGNYSDYSATSSFTVPTVSSGGGGGSGGNNGGGGGSGSSGGSGGFSSGGGGGGGSFGQSNGPSPDPVAVVQPDATESQNSNDGHQGTQVPGDAEQNNNSNNMGGGGFAPCTMTQLLKVGSRGKEVVCMQMILNYYNKTSLMTDGIFGRGTKSVVVNFQKSKGLTADGIVGAKTRIAILSLIGSSTYSTVDNTVDDPQTNSTNNSGSLTCTIYSHLLKAGSRGNDVSCLQSSLNTIMKTHLVADGIFGRGTTTVVKEFQRINKLVADGIVGLNTMSHLKNVI